MLDHYASIVSESSRTSRVEVKSSIGFATPELSASEWDAAVQYGAGYVLAVVDFFGSEQQQLWYVRDPAGTAVPTTIQSVSYRFARADIQPLATEAEFL